MSQQYTSADTSLNQVPAAWRLANEVLERPAHFWAHNRRHLDYGGGKYDTFSKLLAKGGITSLVYDPYNRSQDHNSVVRYVFETDPADVCWISNVLNVIKEPHVRQNLLEDAHKLLREGGVALITVYEGDKSSRGKKTTKGWQSNRLTKNYLREIKRVFPDSYVRGKLIVAKKNYEPLEGYV